MAETFTQFKNSFYARVHDLSVFDCEDHNLLKVVLDGLKVEYAARGILDQSLFASGPVHALKTVAKRVKHRAGIRSARVKSQAVKKTLSVPYFFFDNARVANDTEGHKVSFYFNRIGEYLGWNNCATIYQTNTSLTGGESVNALFLATFFDSYSAEDKSFISSLKATYKKIEALSVFDATELFNIRVAINKFFNEYRFWRFMLKNAAVKYALFDEHYHREGFILALKRKKIQVLELQHGLIAPEDIFYVFPESVASIAHKALFPDRLFTYGSYWSGILKKGHELKPEQITVLGAYQEINTYIEKEQKASLENFLQGREFILVTTQTFLHDYFTEYVAWLSADLISRGQDVNIVVKNHPSEKKEDYARLQALPNVLLLNVNTEYLLSTCKWHVSCYSTTLYDATRHGCENFSLLIEKCRDYIQTFISEGISVLLHENQNPLLLDQAAELTFDKRTLYENFDNYKSRLKEL